MAWFNMQQNQRNDEKRNGGSARRDTCINSISIPGRILSLSTVQREDGDIIDIWSAFVKSTDEMDNHQNGTMENTRTGGSQGRFNNHLTRSDSLMSLGPVPQDEKEYFGLDVDKNNGGCYFSLLPVKVVSLDK